MLSRLEIDTIVQDRYQVARIFGSAETTAAYLVTDLSNQGSCLLWESTERFALNNKPQGVREYFVENDRHYLVLRLENQSLSFLLTIAGQVDETLAGLWLIQMCRAIGSWHNRPEGESLVCLRQGSLNLALFRLLGYDQVMIPSYGDFGQEVQPVLEADLYRFSAPEQDPAALTPRSDVYALGALLYCLVTGQAPPVPEALQLRQARLESPRKLAPDLSRDMERVILKAMQPDPKRRYPTAAEMAADLEAFLIPRLVEDRREVKKKPSLLARLVPFFLALSLLACLAVTFEAVRRPNIDLSWLLALRGQPTPTFTPAPPSTPVDTATPSPTPTVVVTDTATPMPLPTLLPVQKSVVNQVRLDQFPQIIAYASVLDDQQEPVLDLERERFHVLQDGTPIEEFTLDTLNAARDPLAMVVAMDISGSMKGDPLQKARDAAANFVGHFDPGDQVSLVKFDDRIELVQDFTTNKQAVVTAIQSLRSRNDTALYDVIAYAVERLGSQQGRRAVVVLTDGRDTASVKYDLNGCIAVANGSSIPVFIVGLDSPQFTPKIMDQIGTGTGGDYLFAPSPDDLDALYQKIRGQLQNQYRIEFTSRHEADGASHTLSIGLDLGRGQEMWGEKEYVAPR